LPLAANAQAAAATFSIPAIQVTTPPKIDGTLDDPAWQQAAHVQLGWDISFQRAATEQTDAYLLADPKYLYVAFVVKQTEPLTATVHTNDVGLGSDDVVRAYFFPAGDQGFEYFFAANPICTRYEFSSENAAFSPAWDCVSSKTANGYIVTECSSIAASLRPRSSSSGRITPHSAAPTTSSLPDASPT
jgi:hypothetical protein